MSRSSSKSVQSPLNPEAAELIARRFRALADPTRLRILDHLRNTDEASVGEITEMLGASQQNVSKHLGLMLREGVVSRSKDGNYARYAIADDAIFGLCEMVCGTLRQQIAELDSVLKDAA